MKAGTPVHYDAGERGVMLAFVLRTHDDGKVDLQAFDPETGAGGVFKNVPQSGSGGGDTFKPIA